MIHLTEPEQNVLKTFATYPIRGITDEHGRRLMDCDIKRFKELRRRLQQLNLLVDSGEDMRCAADGKNYRVYRIAVGAMKKVGLD